jgi:putative heme-binding domain-containing protein
VSRRTAAVSLLRYASADVSVPALIPLATGEPSQTVRIAAIATLSRFDDPQIGEKLLEDYAAQTPAVRGAILDCLLARPERVALLLEAIESGGIAVSELGPTRVTRLTKHRDAAVRARAEKLVAAAVPADRREVMAKYEPALKRGGDAAAGRAVFEKNCATCHRIGEVGVNVAPDIADSRTRTPEYLLTNILDPNRAVDSNYFSFTVLTTDGQVHTGLVENETATSVTLRQPEGKTVTLLRADIERMKSDGVSLMPVGLEKAVTVEQMADLISFIKNWRYLGGDVPIDLPGQ